MNPKTGLPGPSATLARGAPPWLASTQRVRTQSTERNIFKRDSAGFVTVETKFWITKSHIYEAPGPQFHGAPVSVCVPCASAVRGSLGKGMGNGDCMPHLQLPPIRRSEKHSQPWRRLVRPVPAPPGRRPRCQPAQALKLHHSRLHAAVGPAEGPRPDTKL